MYEHQRKFRQDTDMNTGIIICKYQVLSSVEPPKQSRLSYAIAQ